RLSSLTGCSGAIHLFYLDPINPFSKAFISRECQPIPKAANRHFFLSLQIIHLFEHGLGFIAIEVPNTITDAVPEPRDPLLAILVLDLDRVASRRHSLSKEIDQHSLLPTDRIPREQHVRSDHKR